MGRRVSCWVTSRGHVSRPAPPAPPAPPRPPRPLRHPPHRQSVPAAAPHTAPSHSHYLLPNKISPIAA
ncbi:hypothetical protein JYU34_015548 [Plutella xylostella]|uniref:Uncharacterized protein n=1 Tax=Plutella xylostella TaxID=51655 RepID=A0ABQ7Q459_PLUXY|nr:hypothetical protein JYU34_015548 [Plutella xylostella]